MLTHLRVRGALADPIWQGAGTRRLRGKWHAYTMVLELENWSERITYFLGRYYDLPSQLVLRALLRPGDAMLDVGANIGMLSLLAARIVGPSGRVEAFEPNPYCVGRIRQMLAENGIEHVGVHPVALSDRDGTAQLAVIRSTSGSGTLDPGSAPEMPDARHYEVKTCRGDDLIAADAKRLIAVKIDVEGHEVRVVRGLQDTLAAARPAVLCETVEQHLERAGFRLRELCRGFEWLGYAGYTPRTRRAGRSYQLLLEPLRGELPRGSDTLWLHPESEACARVAGLIAR